MRTTHCGLKLVLGTWDDPGDYPSGAGSGPLPSETYVEYVDGTLHVELEAEDISSVSDYADVDMTMRRMIESYLRDNPESVNHGVASLKVTSWNVETIRGKTIELSVDEFEADPPERSYELDDD